jgi:O-glycosyl hydrolase
MPVRKACLVAATALLTLAGCERANHVATHSSAPDPGATQAEPGTKVLVTGRGAQRMRGWGATVVSGEINDPLAFGGLSRRQQRRLDRLVFRAAGINIVRVFGPGSGSQRGNAGPPSAQDRRFKFMQRTRHYGVRFMLTGADAPPSMKSGASLAVGKEAAYARYLASVLRFAKERLRAPFTYSAIGNEPSWRKALLQMTPEQAALVYAKLARKIRRQRLGVKLVVGDDVGWNYTLIQARAVLDAPGVRRAAVAIASHAYAGTASDRRELAALARRSRLAVWQTEFGTGCPTCPDDRTMSSALVWGGNIVESLTEARASAWFAFRPVANATHGPEDALIVRQYDRPDEPFYTTKRFEVFRQYSSAGRPGSRRLLVQASGEATRAVAFRKGRRIAVVLTNAGDQAIEVELDLGPRQGRLAARRTGSHEDFRALPSTAYPGRPVRVSLPAQSVTTFTLRRAREE